MKRLSIVSFVLWTALTVRAQYGPVPNENQLRWQDMEMYAFIHYSLNTYTDQEWGFGNEDPLLIGVCVQRIVNKRIHFHVLPAQLVLVGHRAILGCRCQRSPQHE